VAFGHHAKKLRSEAADKLDVSEPFWDRASRGYYCPFPAIDTVKEQSAALEGKGLAGLRFAFTGFPVRVGE